MWVLKVSVVGNERSLENKMQEKDSHKYSSSRIHSPSCMQLSCCQCLPTRGNLCYHGSVLLRKALNTWLQTIPARWEADADMTGKDVSRCSQNSIAAKYKTRGAYKSDCLLTSYCYRIG